MKKIFLIFAFGMFALIFLVVFVLWLKINLTGFVAMDLDDLGGSFFEDFESGSLATNEWGVSGAGDNWAIATADPYAGADYIYVENTDGESIIGTGLSTEGYKNISFSFYAKTDRLDPGEYLASDWYDGTSWIEVLNVEDLASYTLYNFSLPSDANDNIDFAIRFRCSSNRNDEFCSVDNVQIIGAVICTPSLVNTTWSDWTNLTCSGDEMNQSRSLIQYDENVCGEVANQTFYEYQLVGPTYQNTTWTAWTNISCLQSDTMNQTRNLTQYDIYGCASNTTFIEYQNTSYCSYCTPSLVNTTWSDWVNISCLSDDTMNQSRSLTQYDENNCVANQTFYEYQNTEFCDFAEPPVSSPPSSSSGGGGGGGTAYYKCDVWGEWSECLDNKQTRKCEEKIRATRSTRGNLTESRVCEETDEALFDVILSILPGNEEIFLDTKEVSFQVDLIKFGFQDELTKVKIDYEIYEEDKSMLGESEELEVQKEISFIKTLELPTLDLGTHQVNVKIKYGEDKTAEGKISFIVKEKFKEGLGFLRTKKSQIYFWAILSFFLLGGGIVIFRKLKKAGF